MRATWHCSLNMITVHLSLIGPQNPKLALLSSHTLVCSDSEISEKLSQTSQSKGALSPIFFSTLFSRQSAVVFLCVYVFTVYFNEHMTNLTLWGNMFTKHHRWPIKLLNWKWFYVYRKMHHMIPTSLFCVYVCLLALKIYLFLSICRLKLTDRLSL